MATTSDEPGGKGTSAEIDSERFRTRDGIEINRVLRDLVRQRQMAVLYFNGSRNFVLTLPLHVDSRSGRLYLDIGADESANQRLLTVGRAQYVSSHHQVRVQFTVSALQKSEWEGKPAFVTPIPESMVRIQRREFFRLAPPVASPPRCRIVVADQSIECTLLDISLGGIGFLHPQQNAPLDLAPGQVIEECTIELPGRAPISSPLEVCNTFEHTTEAGRTRRHIGCRFLQLPPTASAQIQGYILEVELERRRTARGKAT